MRTRIGSDSARTLLCLAAAAVLAAAAAFAVPGTAAAAALAEQQAASSAGSGASQQGEASRVASLLQLAVEEYGAAVRDGRVVNEMEYAEAEAFVRQAEELYAGMLEEGPGELPSGARELSAGFGELAAVIEGKEEVGAFRRRAEEMVQGLSQMWGAAAVELPSRPPSAARGARLYRQGCVPCHGPRGRGDGWAADGMTPRPPDLASDLRRQEATLARDYRVIAYGIPRTAMPEYREWLSVDERWDLAAYVQSLRFSGEQVTVGKSLAFGGGAAEGSVGSRAAGDGTGDDASASGADGSAGSGSPLAGRLRRWGSVEPTLRLTDPELADAVRSAWSESGREPLSVEQVRAVVAYARSLLGTPEAGLPEPDRAQVVAARLSRVDSLLSAAASLARDGDVAAARGTALESYMAFEGLEGEIRARDPGLAGSAEAAFADFRASLGTQEMEAVRSELDRRLTQVEETLTSASSGWALAGQSFFIILREGFEAILIIGAIIAFLMKTDNERHRRSVYGGVGAALLASVLTAVAMETLFAISPADREILEGATMLLATAVLFSVSYWLLSKLEHEKWERYLREKTQRAVTTGSGLALAGVAFLAVYREGFETVLFYKALVISAGGGLGPIALGFAAGCAALAAIYLAFTRYGVRVPMRPFFAVTSGVLYYMAVVFAGQGIRELQAAGAVGLTRVEGVPRVELLGLYPTAETLAAQVVLLLILVAGLWLTFGRRGEAAEPAGAG